VRKVLADSPSLIAEGRAIALDPAAVEVDVVRFEALAQAAHEDAQAAKLYQGDFLEGFVLREPAFEEWLVGGRERLREIALATLRRLLDEHMRVGATELATRTALRLVGLDAAQEIAHRALMRLYAQQGRRATALRQYQACVGILRRERGTEPEAETRALHQRVRRRPCRRGQMGKRRRTMRGSIRVRISPTARVVK
jgi:DNA-binding SARP family transcriptional activator